MLDLFCGLGNFTLPIARSVALVVGVEGDAGLVQRARDNALRNAVDNVEYHAVDLTATRPASRGCKNVILGFCWTHRAAEHRK